MHENNILSNYNIEVCINDNIEPISVELFTALCDRYTYKKICDFLTRLSISVYFYTLYNNKIESTFIFTKKS